MDITKKIADCARERLANLSEMARETGLPYAAIYASLRDKNKSRRLSVDEAILICRFLGVNLMDFADKPQRKGHWLSQ